ncbi:MAG TPA: prepilin-type cleavage/methylation domain-containing protein [Gammaproteobacteria bacterium]|nr:prepilin-type cleavage/methylation domain-containing protein [Gammaproteobacteria bacterium]
MYTFPYKKRGFSLVELAVVLVVVGLLLGMILKPLGAGFDQSKRRQASLQLTHVRDAVVGFAVAHGRLPCPALSGGQEAEPCVQAHGYVPAATLGVHGNVDDSGRLLDPWNRPIHFSVSLADAPDVGTAGTPDFLDAGELQRVGMRDLRGDLQVCRHANNHCTQQHLRANQIPMVVYSLGKDASRSGDQLENQDGDGVFASRTYSEVPGQEFDDIVLWLSENILFTRLMEAGVLP